MCLSGPTMTRFLSRMCAYYAAQIAVEVSRLTELKRAQRHQPEVSQPCHNQRHSETERDYELATVKVSAIYLDFNVGVYVHMLCLLQFTECGVP